MTHWAYEAIFYHVYPLGLCGAPERNDFCSPPAARLKQLAGWMEHWQALGVNALYLGPLFESSAHGYDTADYYHVDRRLGDNAALAELAAALHQRGFHLILDGVFNHVGRDFWAFRDVQQRGPQSAYVDWFQGLTFSRRSPYNDPFTYEGWNGHYDLVKLNLHTPAVRQHLFQAIELWVQAFGIDGLRLDVADSLDFDFLKALSAFCRGLRPDFWLMGEVVHGDYRKWANAERLASVTNYECYKGLYSSHVDRNYFEIAYALNRQFGPEGLYRQIPLYNFADNHDVNRVASNLQNSAHLFPLYCLLFTMPGVPSIYYGSEWGLEGRRDRSTDRPLRPPVDLATAPRTSPHPELAGAIARLAHLRRQSPALKYGDYAQLFVAAEQLGFVRQAPEECVIVVVNAADRPAPVDLAVPTNYGSELVDRLNPGETFKLAGRKAHLDVPPHWARVLAVH